MRRRSLAGITGRNRQWATAIGCIFSLAAGTRAPAQQPSRIDVGRDVGLDQKLNAQVPPDVSFRDETGKAVTLGDYFGKMPVILIMPFYKCKGSCTLEMDGLVKSLVKVNFNPGEQFRILTVSINPNEGPELAAAKKRAYMKLYSREGAEKGWSFLTGQESQIKRLAAAVGFRYVYNPATDDYAHPTGAMILTPRGKLSHYLYGFNFNPRDLRLALVEAGENKIGSPVDQFLLMCYHYDPGTGKYGLVVTNLLRFFGGLTVLILAGGILIMLRLEKLRARTLDTSATKPVINA